MEQKKVDRRVRKTKMQLRNGLTQLMKEKNIHEITVSELVNLVDINRSTFYLHYSDIYDMLSKIEDELIDELTKLNIIFQSERESKHEIENIIAIKKYLVEVFTYLKENEAICEALLGPNGDAAFVEHVKHLIFNIIVTEAVARFGKEQSKEKIEFACAFYITGCIGVISQWLTEGGMEYPEYMADLCYSLINDGLEARVRKIID